MTVSTVPAVVAPSAARRTTWLARLTWLVLCALAFAWFDRLGRGLSFFFDEWDWVINRHAGVRTLFLAHNGHFSLVPALAFRVLFHTVGLADYRPYRWVGLAVHLGVATALALIVARRRGRVDGLALGAVVLFLGTGYENILWPFQIGMMGSLGFALVVWLLLDHRTRRSDIGAAVALCLSVASSGPGIALTAGVVTRLAWRRDDRRRLWVVAAPMAEYAIWWLKFGESQGRLGNLRWTGSYVRDLAASGIAALGGRNLDWGRTAIGFAAAIVLVTVARRRSVTAEQAGIAAALGLNWLLTTYARGDLQEPYGSRYAYLSAVLLVALWAELFRRPPGATWHERRHRRTAAATLVVLSLLAIRGNRHPIDVGAAGLRAISAGVRADLRALEWAHDPPSVYRPDERWAPPVFAGPYLATVRDLASSPALPADALRRAAPEVRAGADRVSLELAAPYLVAATPSTPAADCPSPTIEQLVTLTASASAVIVPADAPVEVRMRRFADQFAEEPTAVVAPGQPMRLSRPIDDGPATWYADVRSAAPFQLCDASVG